MRVTNLKNGTYFKDQGKVYQVVEYRHQNISRGSASVRVKVRDVISEAVLSKNYQSHASVEEADVSRREVKFLYQDGTHYVFADPETYEQFELLDTTLSSAKFYLSEGASVVLVFVGGSPVGVEMSPKVTLKVTQTDPGVRGDSAGRATKPAVLESGLKVNVPLFINEGDAVRVSTGRGEYVGRASV